MSDIVDRLRSGKARDEEGAHYLCTVAADEIERLRVTPSGAHHLSMDVLLSEAAKIGPLEDEIKRLRAALREICELRHDITCAHIIAEEALGE